MIIWLVIQRKDSAVIGTQVGRPPPTDAWNLDLFEIKPWAGSQPAIHDIVIDPPIESYDPWLTATWDDVRALRDWLLRESDWSQIEDVPFATVDRNSWKAYRKTLRDIPQSFEKPQDVVWPERPL